MCDINNLIPFVQCLNQIGSRFFYVKLASYSAHGEMGTLSRANAANAAFNGHVNADAPQI